MALNKVILQKLNVYTKDNESLREFIIDLLQFESSYSGWFDKEYVKMLENHCQGGERH